jgi:hypothetical protein
VNIKDWGGTERSKEYQTGITVDWTDKRLSSIDRLRYVGECGIYDFSYAYGTLRDGTKCRVRPGDGAYQFLVRPGKSIRGLLIEAAKRDRVYLKGLGALDALSINE